MKGSEAFDWLVQAGYMQINEVGWGRIVKPPKRKDLHLFVLAIKTLGAWSVAGGDIQMSCGGDPNEVLFRKRNGDKS